MDALPLPSLRLGGRSCRRWCWCRRIRLVFLVVLVVAVEAEQRSRSRSRRIFGRRRHVLFRHRCRCWCAASSLRRRHGERRATKVEHRAASTTAAAALPALAHGVRRRRGKNKKEDRTGARGHAVARARAAAPSRGTSAVRRRLYKCITLQHISVYAMPSSFTRTLSRTHEQVKGETGLERPSERKRIDLSSLSAETFLA